MEANVATMLGGSSANYSTSESREIVVSTAAAVCDPNEGNCGDDEEPLECDPNVEECECDPDVEECTPEVCDPNVEECECDPDVEECAPVVCDPDDADCECDPDIQDCTYDYGECDPDVEECEDPDSATTFATCATLGALSLFI